MLRITRPAMSFSHTLMTLAIWLNRTGTARGGAPWGWSFTLDVRVSGVWPGSAHGGREVRGGGASVTEEHGMGTP